MGDKKYSGILAKPWPQYTLLTEPPEEERSALRDSKMKALLIHYGLDADLAFSNDFARRAVMWEMLAIQLARQHVPGFRPPVKKRGRPPKLQQENLTLLLDIELLERRDRLSERAAMRQIAEEAASNVPGETLRSRNKKFKEKTKFLKKFLDRIEAKIGTDNLVEVLEAARLGDK